MEKYEYVLEDLPDGWTTTRLKNVVRVIVSNIDKHRRPLEQTVKLCNYVDVYKNHYVTSGIRFMAATANSSQVKKFKVEVGDVAITKDSEDFTDIGVPALMTCEEENLVYGYHLAILKPSDKINSEFLLWVINSSRVQHQFSISANGITRYGLGYNDIQSAVIPLPCLDEQKNIGAYVEQINEKINTAITNQQKLITLLQERKQIIIQRAATRGLDARVEMKDSGVEWMSFAAASGGGEVPGHWEVKRLKYILDERKERSEEGTEPLLMVSQLHGLVDRSNYHDKAEVAASNVGNKVVYENDLVFNKLKAHLGVFFKSTIKQPGIVSPDYAVYYSTGAIKDLKFLELLFRHPSYIGQFIIRATGIVEGLIRLYTGDLFDIEVAVPPREEQLEILHYINN